MDKVFTASPGVNAWGVVGLIIMIVGALMNFVFARYGSKHVITIRVVGLLLALIGAVLVIAIGK